MKSNGLSVHTFFVIGFPGETKEDRRLTRRLILDIGFDWNGIFIATPYKGSRLYELCIEKGYISEQNIVNATIYKCEISAPGIDPLKITKEAYMMNLDMNFVNNYNYVNGFYEKAAAYFKGVVDKYPAHAFANYFLAKTMEKITDSNNDTINKYYDKYVKIIEVDSKWREYAKHFNLEKAGV